MINWLEDGFGLLPLSIMADDKLSYGAKVLFAALCYHNRNKQGNCFPRNQILADELGTSVRHITRLLSELKDNGFINFENRSSSRGYQRHIIFLKYFIAMDNAISDCYQSKLELFEP